MNILLRREPLKRFVRPLQRERLHLPGNLASTVSLSTASRLATDPQTDVVKWASVGDRAERKGTCPPAAEHNDDSGCADAVCVEMEGGIRAAAKSRMMWARGRGSAGSTASMRPESHGPFPFIGARIDCNDVDVRQQPEVLDGELPEFTRSIHQAQSPRYREPHGRGILCTAR